MQDDMSQEEIDAILKSAMDSASAANSEADASEDNSQDQNPPDTVQDLSSGQANQQATGPSKETPAGERQTNSFQAAPVAIGNINFLLDVPLDVAVELGRTKIAIKDMLKLGPGSVIELDKLIGEPVDLLVNDRLIAKGEVVVFDENFGIRITDIMNPEERLRSLE